MNYPTLKSILLVDDDEISNLFNKIFIRKLNLGIDISVDIVLNGQEALEFVTSFKNLPNPILPCLLLLDMKMPIMDGWQFLDAYQEQVSQEIKDQITIVMLTTSTDEVDAVKAMNNPNVKAFIQKPLSEQIFINLIETHFENLII